MRSSRNTTLCATGVALSFFLLPACHKHEPNPGQAPGGGPGGGPPVGNFHPGQILDADGGVNPLRVDLPGRLSVLVQVTDTAGNPVSGLTNDNFALFEDGQLVSPTESQQQLLPRPRVFRSFSHLLLDISGSVAQTPQGIQTEIEAATAFIDEVTQSSENYVAISWFFGGQNIAPSLLDNFSPLGFSNDRERLIEAVENVNLIQVTSTSTNLYGAIIEGLDVLDEARFQSVSSVEFQSLTLVTFTDGTDQAGLVSREAAIERISNGPNNYNAQAIGLGQELDTQTLNAIGPNGWLLADNLGDLNNLFSQVGGNVRDVANSFYLVGYISPKVHSTQQRTLTVEASRAGSTASKDYPFVPEFFSGGGGFLEVRDEVGADPVSAWVDLAETPSGGSVLLGRNLGVGVATRSLSLRGLTDTLAVDTGFAQNGDLQMNSWFNRDFLEPKRIAIAPDGTIYLAALIADHLQDTEKRVALGVFSPQGVKLTERLVDVVVVGNEEIADLTFNSNGALMLLSRVGEPASYRTCLRRFLPVSLNLDETFSMDGVQLLNAPGAQMDNPSDLMADSQGGAYYTGQGHNQLTGSVDMIVAHVLADGSLDSTFGNDGLVMGSSFTNATLTAKGCCMEMDAAQNLIIGGQLTPTGSAQTRADFWRLLPTGAPDASFFGNASNPFFGSGVVTLGNNLTQNPNVLFGNASQVRRLRVLPDGSIFGAGERFNARGDRDLCSWRLNSSGLFNVTYNFTGFLIEDGSVSQDCDDILGGMRFLDGGQVLFAGGGVPAPPAVPSAVLWVDSDQIRRVQ